MSRPRHDHPAPTRQPLQDAVDATLAAGTNNAVAPSTLALYAKNWAVIERWCDANGLDALDLDDRGVAAFLHAHRHLRWSVARCQSYTCAAGHHLCVAGRPDPGGPVTRTWLYVYRKTCEPPTAPPTDALTNGDALALLGGAAVRDDVEPIVVMYRCILACGPTLQLSLAQLAKIRLADLTATADGWSLPGHGGHRHEFASDDANDPTGAYLDVLAATDAAPESRLFRYTSFILANGLTAAATRAGLSERWTVDPWPGAGLTDSERDWLCVFFDRRSLCALRTVTWVLVALATTQRHDELARWTIENLTQTADGWTVHVGKSKSDQAGRNPTWDVPHGPLLGEPDDGTGACTSMCPACALGRWLKILQVTVGVTEGRVFPAFHGWHATGELSSEKASQSLAALMTSLGCHDGRTMSSRSTRVGSVSTAHLAGKSLDEIRDMLRHTSFGVLLRYIRHVNPYTQTPQLQFPATT